MANRKNSNVRDVGWHKQVVLNLQASAESAKKQLEEAQRRYDDIVAYAAELQAQILEAERRGITEFDSERFNKPRGKK